MSRIADLNAAFDRLLRRQQRAGSYRLLSDTVVRVRPDDTPFVDFAPAFPVGEQMLREDLALAQSMIEELRADVRRLQAEVVELKARAIDSGDRRTLCGTTSKTPVSMTPSVRDEQ